MQHVAIKLPDDLCIDIAFHGDLREIIAFFTRELQLEKLKCGRVINPRGRAVFR
jgi:hypothetical protein